jgi:aspartate racemase
LHIADVVAGKAAERGFRRIGLTGTRWLVNSSVYPDRLSAKGMESVRPSDAECQEISRIIMEELVDGRFLPESVAYFQRTIHNLAQEGCDAVALACTEIPLIINDGNSALPTLDSTRLLAKAAVSRAIHAGSANGA